MKSSSQYINRKCVVCGKNIKAIILDKRGHYTDAHYFGKMQIPVKGTGTYKKIGTSKLFNANIVKWTGKEKEVEYWECNGCYDEAI